MTIPDIISATEWGGITRAAETLGVSVATASRIKDGAQLPSFSAVARAWAAWPGRLDLREEMRRRYPDASIAVLDAHADVVRAMSRALAVEATQ